MQVSIDAEFTRTTLRELVRIDSRNPGLEAGAPGEWELAHHVAGLLKGFGWSADVHDLGKPRANVVARWPGTGQGQSLMINVHLDTVGTKGMKNPFGGEMREGKVFGRGAQDIKGGVAAALAVAKLIAEEQIELQGGLVLAFVADEEHESLGTEALVQQVATDAAIVLEPSELDVCIAHRGFGIFRLQTRGRAAHGGASDLGIDANTHMGHLLVALDGLRSSWEQSMLHPMLGSATLHVPLLSGGRQLFMYADRCTMELECRTIPGQSAESVLAELESILEGLRRRVPDFRASVEMIQWRAPYSVDADSRLVRTVLAAATEVRGQAAELIAHPWWEDSAILGEAGIETLVIGPSGGGLHTDDEWVDADSVVQLAEILFRSVLAYCGPGGTGAGRLYRLSAFTTTPDGGNPAGVWIGDQLPQPEDMQLIANQIGFSETAFIAPTEGRRRTVRYYSPEAEVPFCGHATIASGVKLGELDGEGEYVFETVPGEVTVAVRTIDGRTEAALTSVTPKHQPPPPDLLWRVLATLSWDDTEIDQSIPPALAFAGAWHLVIAAKTAERLNRLDYDFDALKRVMLEADLTTIQLLWRERPDLYHARDPFPVGGVVEDPATGAAAAAFGGYLRDANLIDAPADIVILQGEAMGRPSRLKVHIPAQGGIVVSGHAVALGQ